MIFSGSNSLKMALAAGVFLLAQSAQAMPISSFDILVTDVDFNAGGVIDFSADNFTVQGQVGGDGDLIGLAGDIDGTFSFSPLTPLLGSVTSSLGMLEIDDGGGGMLTADLDLNSVGFFDAGLFQFVSLSGSLTFDSYIGGNADMALLAATSGLFDISIGFVYNGLTTLASLHTSGDGGLSPGPAAGLVALPEPRSLALLGLGLLGVGLYGRKRQRDQAQQRVSRSESNASKTSIASYGMELTR